MVKNKNPGPGAYDLTASAKLMHRKKPTVMYKLPTLNSSTKNMKENMTATQFYDNKLSLNPFGIYPSSKVPNYNAPLIRASMLAEKFKG